jgi:hypothetical protein
VLVAEPLPVHAASSLVQQNSGGCDPCTDGFVYWPISVSFTDNVVSGNVVVVAAVAEAQTVTSISDSLLSSYNLAVTKSDFVANVYIYYTTLTASGADTVTVTFSQSSSATAYVFIYEVTGVTNTGVGTASGSGQGSPVFNPVQMTTSTSVVFQPGAFLLGVIWIGSNSYPTTAGQGFTLSPSSPLWAQAEYSTGGVSSPTNFPATFGPTGFGGSAYWVEAGVALNLPIVAYRICVIRLGVQEQNGTIGWLPGYGYPGTPISECQNRTDVLGQDVLDRTIMIHQFILNFTSTG